MGGHAGRSISSAYKNSPLGGLTGSRGGVNGTGIEGPQAAEIEQGTSVADVTNAQNAAGNSIASQQALLQALQGQNGLGQQNNVAAQQQALAQQLAANQGAVNQGAAMSRQGALNDQLAAANGVGTQNAAIAGLGNVAAHQGGLEQQYQDIAAGRGPNPAMAQLNQTTAQNVANQAALMAGQRGAASNVGLMARQAAQQGAATQQQAVGQGATMEAQQRLGALQGVGNTQAAQAATQQAIGGLGSTQVGMEQAGIGAQGNLAAQQIAAQQAQQQAMANQANQVAGQQLGMQNVIAQNTLANQGQMQGALQGINNARVGNQGNINTANAAMANTTMQGQQGLMGGILGGIGASAGLGGGKAMGGEIKKPKNMAEGGWTGMVPMTAPMAGPMPAPAAAPVAAPVTAVEDTPAPKDSYSQFMEDFNNMGGNAGAKALNKGASSAVSGLAKYAAMAADGGLATTGGHVAAKAPAQKAIKSGDSYDNDKIPAKLSEGEIVLPRSVTMSKDPIGASAKFVEKILAKRKAK